MDIWKIAGNKEVGYGGMGCACCSPIGKKSRSKDKQAHHQIARSRLKAETFSEILEAEIKRLENDDGA